MKSPRCASNSARSIAPTVRTCRDGCRGLFRTNHLRHLDKYFSGQRLGSIGGAEATSYVADRQKRGAANGTINRELGVLERLLALAYERNKLTRKPVIRP